MKTFKSLLALCFLAMMVGCGGSQSKDSLLTDEDLPDEESATTESENESESESEANDEIPMYGLEGPGTSPLVGKRTESVTVWRLDKMMDIPRSWDSFSELLNVNPVSERFEDLFEDLAKQSVTVVYGSRNRLGVYFAFDVSSCNRKQGREVKELLKDFCNDLNEQTDFKMQFYSTDQDFYYVGPSDDAFEEAVENAKFRSWKKEDCWDLIQQSFSEPFFFALVGNGIVGDENLAILDAFPFHFGIPNRMRTSQKFRKYAAPLGSDTAVFVKADSILKISASGNPQKSVYAYQVTLDSRENAQRVQKLFQNYMSDLAMALGDTQITSFLNSQKPKIVGNSVVWEYDASWMKENRKLMRNFKEAVEEYRE